MNNSIMIIRPYDYHGIWVFDDPATNLYREAFVSGIDKMIDILTKNISDAKNGFLMLFSANEFPDYDVMIELVREENGGNWYWSEKYQIEGWLCPALFKYFDKAPEFIYVQACKNENKYEAERDRMKNKHPQESYESKFAQQEKDYG